MLALSLAQPGVALPAQTGGGGTLVIILLCALAGVGTFLMLPGRAESSVRKIGGVIVLVAGLVAMALLVRTAAVRTAGDVYFWAFSFIAIGASLRVITHPKPVYAALYFVLTVLASAGLFVLLWAEFMAAALVLIYAGAILVTYVFVIMLAQQAHTGASGEVGGAEYDITSREPLLATAIGFVMMAVLLFVIFDKGQSQAVASGQWLVASNQPADAPGVQELGDYLFRSQALNLELAGVILAMAMVGAVVIARRRVVSETPLAPMEVSSKDAPIDDDPHSIPVSGTMNPAAKAWPEK